MPSYYSLLLSLIFVFGLQNCEKKCDFDQIDGEVTIHLLKDFDGPGLNCEIDESNIHWESMPYIDYDDLKSYDPEEHIFALSTELILQLKDGQDELHQKAFAVLIDGQLIYTCYFWLAWSSLSCDWYTTDPLMIDYYGGLKIKSAYPGDPELGDNDQRNDPRILCVFERDGKLK
jgi:hypothetical protein